MTTKKDWMIKEFGGGPLVVVVAATVFFELLC
jgi:hypothetical protein